MSKYAVYDAARIYHLMRDEKRTECGVNVFASNYGDRHQGYGSPLKMVESIPDGLRLCPYCSDESGKQKGGKG